MLLKGSLYITFQLMKLEQVIFLAVSKSFVLIFTRASLFRVNAFLINHSVCFGNA